MNTDEESRNDSSSSVKICAPSVANIVFLHGRRLVLKRLDDDCLLDGDLHPSIRLRLSRIRELPMTGVANLHGVKVVDGQPVLVWDYLEGRTLDEIEPEDRAKLQSDVRLLVQQLHSLGIVHGALHGRNIVVDKRGQVRLTHLSPLLHNDFERDMRAIEELFRPTPSPGTPGEGRVRVRAGDDRLASNVSRVNPHPNLLPEYREKEQSRINVVAVVGAVAAIVVGLIIVASVLWYA